MNADVFFNRKISSRYRNRVEKERFTLQPIKAKKYVKKYDKPSTRNVEFEQWQIDLANRLFGE